MAVHEGEDLRQIGGLLPVSRDMAAKRLVEIQRPACSRHTPARPTCPGAGRRADMLTGMPGLRGG